MTDVGMTATSCCEIRVAASTSCRQCAIACEFDGLMSPAARWRRSKKSAHRCKAYSRPGENPKLLFSNDRADDPSVYTQRRAVGRGGKRTGHEDDQRGDFFDRGEALEQGAGTNGCEELFFDARPFNALGVSDLIHEFFHTVGARRTC